MICWGNIYGYIYTRGLWSNPSGVSLEIEEDNKKQLVEPLGSLGLQVPQ
jgi:hypothetical protein